MLFNLLTVGKDFEKSMRQRRWLALGLLAIGLVGLVCYWRLVPRSGLGDYARGFYLGAACGLSAAGLMFLVRVQYLLTHPEARKRARIRETDEREVRLTQTACQAAGVAAFYGAALGLFVVLPLSMEAFAALLAVVVLYTLAFAAATLWLRARA